jgi:hypothetical protein
MTPALAAVRFTIPCTARAVSRPPLRLANTGSFAPASPRNVSSDRLTISGKSIENLMQERTLAWRHTLHQMLDGVSRGSD